nr:tyrosine-type recombinase/integrase [Roseomonas sp. SXEYE001]
MKARKPSGGPLLSELAAQFLQERGAGESAVSGQHLHQSAATYRLTMELLGDVPPADLTRRHAAELRGLLLRLPASHGKARNGKTAIKAIEEADGQQATGQQVERLKEKTCKRHFSALQQLWKWLADRELVTLNPFEGWTFKNGKASQARDDWSELDLLRLLETPWLGHDEPWDSHRRWFPMIAMWSGMRLEEIARLRPVDVQLLQGTPTILIQDQPAMGDLPPWTPKTEAGARAVPVHPELQRLGFLDLMEHRRAAKASRLFPELRPTGPDRKLGVEFSRRFSKLKIDAGIGERTTFHSFRHSVSTILRNTTLREEWIDAVLGHESGSRSQGAQVYLKRIGIENLTATVQAVKYPGRVMECLGRRSHQFRDAGRLLLAREG